MEKHERCKETVLCSNVSLYCTYIYNIYIYIYVYTCTYSQRVLHSFSLVILLKVAHLVPENCGEDARDAHFVMHIFFRVGGKTPTALRAGYVTGSK